MKIEFLISMNILMHGGDEWVRGFYYLNIFLMQPQEKPRNYDSTPYETRTYDFSQLCRLCAER